MMSRIVSGQVDGVEAENWLRGALQQENVDSATRAYALFELAHRANARQAIAEHQEAPDVELEILQTLSEIPKIESEIIRTDSAAALVLAEMYEKIPDFQESANKCF